MSDAALRYLEILESTNPSPEVAAVIEKLRAEHAELAERDRRVQYVAWELGHIAGENYANCIEDANNPYEETE